MPSSVRLRSCVLFLLLFPFAAAAATPTSGTLTPTSGPLTYSSGPFLQPNPTPIPEYDIGPECNNPIEVCDFYALTVVEKLGIGGVLRAGLACYSTIDEVERLIEGVRAIATS